jgi:hypothetical protein
MHPIERLRYVARASGAPPAAVARESIGALMTFDEDPRGLLNACRRLVTRHPRSGPMIWLASRVLTAGDPRSEARAAAAELDGDPTAEELSYALADDATVVVIGWPEVIGRALVRRGDIEVLAIDAHGEGSAFARRLEQGDACAASIPCEGVAAAIAACDVVLLEASAIGPQQFVAVAGSFAAAAVARAVDVPVWLVGGVGRVLPERVFDAVAARVGDVSEPWNDEDELVPIDFVDHIVGPAGVLPSAQALRDCACPIAPELFGNLDDG